MARSSGKDNEQYSHAEAKERFLKSLKAAVSTPPKPLKSMTPKGTPSQSKKAKKKRA